MTSPKTVTFTWQVVDNVKLHLELTSDKTIKDMLISYHF